MERSASYRIVNPLGGSGRLVPKSVAATWRKASSDIVSKWASVEARIAPKSLLSWLQL